MGASRSGRSRAAGMTGPAPTAASALAAQRGAANDGGGGAVPDRRGRGLGRSRHLERGRRPLGHLSRGEMTDQSSIFDNGDGNNFERADDEAHARNTDPWTSHAAAHLISPQDLRESQRAVFDCFTVNGPMHHQRLVETYAYDRVVTGWPLQSESGLRTRTHELVAVGLLRNSGNVVTLPSKRKSIVWEIP